MAGEELSFFSEFAKSLARSQELKLAEMLQRQAEERAEQRRIDQYDREEQSREKAWTRSLRHDEDTWARTVSREDMLRELAESKGYQNELRLLAPYYPEGMTLQTIAGDDNLIDAAEWTNAFGKIDPTRRAMLSEAARSGNFERLSSADIDTAMRMMLTDAQLKTQRLQAEQLGLSIEALTDENKNRRELSDHLGINPSAAEFVKGRMRELYKEMQTNGVLSTPQQLDLYIKVYQLHQANVDNLTRLYMKNADIVRFLTTGAGDDDMMQAVMDQEGMGQDRKAILANAELAMREYEKQLKSASINDIYNDPKFQQALDPNKLRIFDEFIELGGGTLEKASKTSFLTLGFNVLSNYQQPVGDQSLEDLANEIKDKLPQEDASFGPGWQSDANYGSPGPIDWGAVPGASAPTAPSRVSAPQSQAYAPETSASTLRTTRPSPEPSGTKFSGDYVLRDVERYIESLPSREYHGRIMRQTQDGSWWDEMALRYAILSENALTQGTSGFSAARELRNQPYK